MPSKWVGPGVWVDAPVLTGLIVDPCGFIWRQGNRTFPHHFFGPLEFRAFDVSRISRSIARNLW